MTEAYQINQMHIVSENISEVNNWGLRNSVLSMLLFFRAEQLGCISL